MVAGSAVNRTTRGAVPWVTWTVTLQVIGPRGLRAVRVYVVVAVGETTRVPLRSTFPIPLISTDSALDVA